MVSSPPISLLYLPHTMLSYMPLLATSSLPRFGVCPYHLYPIAEDTGSEQLCHFLRITSQSLAELGVAPRWTDSLNPHFPWALSFLLTP